jgi:hypothetical protein
MIDQAKRSHKLSDGQNKLKGKKITSVAFDFANARNEEEKTHVEAFDEINENIPIETDEKSHDIWMYANDKQIGFVDIEKVLKCQCYILFYTKSKIN